MNMNTSTTKAATVFESITKAGSVAPTTLNGLPGMSSLEIAEITGKDHSRVLKDVRKMLKELALSGAGKTDASSYVETSYQSIQNKTHPMVILDKDLTFTLITGYSIKLCHLVVKRWSALEVEKDTSAALRSVQDTVVHLAESEKDNYREAMRALRRSPQSKSPAAMAYRGEKASREKESRCIRANTKAAGGL
jgi:phage regulator Rha-like protein